jgi:hypothetical protein
MFVKCRPKIVKEEPSGIVFPSYDTTEFPYYALLHGLSSEDADGIAVNDEVYSFVVTTQQADTFTYAGSVWLWKSGIGKSCTWLSKDGRNWVQTRDNVLRYGHTELEKNLVYNTKASVLVEDNISG